MNTAERFRNSALVFAAVTTVLYWLAYADNVRVAAERRSALAAVSLPIPLNGFKPILGAGVAGPGPTPETGVLDRGHLRLILVVKDSCPGCGIAVPQWTDWIRSSPQNDYSAVVISLGGTLYQSQIKAALQHRGVKATALQ